MNSLNYIVAKITTIAAYYLMPEMVIRTNRFDYGNMISIGSICISIFCFVVYNETMKHKTDITDADNLESSFNVKDLKLLDKKFYLLSFLNFTTNGAFWAFMALMMQYLTISCNIPYIQAKNLIVCIPIIQTFLILAIMLIVMKYNNE